MDRRNPNPHSDSESILDTLGEEVVRIVAPVSACMLLVVLLVTVLNSGARADLFSIATVAFSSSTPSSSGGGGDASLWDQLTGAILSSLVFVVLITLLTFALVLLFYLRCNSCLRSYLAFSTFVVLALLGGQIGLLLAARFGIPLDVAAGALLLLNFAVVGVMAVLSSPKVPILMTQGYLVLIGVFVAYWFTLLPEWTTWALLVGVALYDVVAVLLPGGPLRLLLELAMSRDEELPALVYEARPVEPRPGARLWRERRQIPANSSPVTSSDGGDSSALPETRLVMAEEAPAVPELTAPLVQRQPEQDGNEEEEADGIGLSSSGAIKLGLGDFIFYSVLVGRASQYDYMTVYACYLAILAGLGVTLMFLAVYRKAMPALPMSIALGLLFYLLTRMLLEVFVVQCSVNLLMF